MTAGDDFPLYDEETVAAIEGWEPPEDRPAPGVAGWRRRGATGAVVGAALLGLGDALEGRERREVPPIVADDPGQPRDPDALVDVELDPDHPAASVARVRPPAPPPGPERAVTPPP